MKTGEQRSNSKYWAKNKKYINKRRRALWKSDPYYKVQKDTHQAVKFAIRKGTLKRKSCELCGAKKVDAHHDDYSKPLSVRWLCRKHHRQVH